MVVDTSVLLTVLFDEEHAAWAAGQMEAHAGELRMSTVNLTECLIRIRDRQPQLAPMLEARVLESGIRFVAPDVAQAQLAAEARLRFPINLGDCFAYALAKAEHCGVLAIDEDFRKVDVPVELPPHAER